MFTKPHEKQKVVQCLVIKFCIPRLITIPESCIEKQKKKDVWDIHNAEMFYVVNQRPPMGD